MDKYEYKVRADEIKELIAQGEYVQAAEIADTIDWRRVKSVMMLCTISDLYKINRRLEDARDMLLLAYERRPGGRTICYSLCELSIKMEEFLQAVEYYKEFVQIAPKDPGRYVLQYKLYEAQDVSLEERIEVLEELKKRDYRERWAYELAYLYHRVGLATRCVEECDELILWFGEGKYVTKAMELKMLHQPLTPEQQDKYDHRFEVEAQETLIPEGEAQEQAYAGGQSYGYEQGYTDEQSYPGGQEYGEEQPYAGGQGYDNAQGYETYGDDYSGGEQDAGMPPQDEMDIHVKTMNVGQYDTMNLQAELAAGLREVLGEEHGRAVRKENITRSIMEPMMSSDTENLDSSRIKEVDENDLLPEAEEMEGSEVFFGETGEIGDLLPEDQMEMEEFLAEEPEGSEEPERTGQAEQIETPGENAAQTVPDITGEIVMEQMRQENASGSVLQESLQAEPPKDWPMFCLRKRMDRSAW